MSILRELRRKIKAAPRGLWNDVFIAVVILLVSLASFGLGRLSVLYGDQSNVEIIFPQGQEGAAYRALHIEDAEQAAREAPFPTGGGQYVASKSGSKYHFPWCAGAQAIKEENKIWFDSKEDAERQGYTPAANCKGL